ncbi:uncharacterized protein BO96DRAFT_407076 [Aspergillus niger CBS 101883]|uniref:uncharacterized protein n=1 Tax=Aspergillus lacticoffeatus (strain CBS 101883) TaxID=1450533 RepID=UPI000D803EE8|nr:uncharacterized protein BO96DRAFT_407076 [Aspergillus niger CBS 101883]PYH62417.1 hypothetical protein BO96DRAFT_407076 [Aspergillus niger CBS 101883]
MMLIPSRGVISSIQLTTLTCFLFTSVTRPLPTRGTWMTRIGLRSSEILLSPANMEIKSGRSPNMPQKVKPLALPELSSMDACWTRKYIRSSAFY